MYVNRVCNRVAHALAKQVSDGNRVGEWQLAPTYIANLLTEDCNHVCPWLIQVSSRKKKSEAARVGKKGREEIITYGTRLWCCVVNDEEGGRRVRSAVEEEKKFKVPVIQN